MITLQYGDIFFPEVNIRGFESKPVNHGPDFLYSENTLHLRVLATTSIGGAPAYQLQQNLVDFLRPRQTLSLLIEGKEWHVVRAPDLTWGPFPRYANVIQVIGPRAAWIDLAISWTSRPASETDEFFILSNRWTAEDSTNNRFWKAQVYTGETVFRADTLNATGRKAFDLRAAFLQSVAAGYKRNNLRTTVSEDGLVVRWSFTDVQVPFVTVAPYVADVAMTISAKAATESTTSIVMNAFDLGLQTVSQGLEYSTFSPGGGPAIAVAAGLKLAGGAVKLVLGLVPSCQVQVETTVYGIPSANPADLQDLARILTILRTVVMVSDVRKVSTTQVVAAGQSTDVRERIATYSLIIERNAIASLAGRDWNKVAAATAIPAFAKTLGVDTLKRLFSSDGVVQSMEYYIQGMTSNSLDEVVGALNSGAKPSNDFDGGQDVPALFSAALADNTGTELDQPFTAATRTVRFL